jgi:hypothetical protein
MTEYWQGFRDALFLFCFLGAAFAAVLYLAFYETCKVEWQEENDYAEDPPSKGVANE